MKFLSMALLLSLNTLGHTAEENSIILYPGGSEFITVAPVTARCIQSPLSKRIENLSGDVLIGLARAKGIGNCRLTSSSADNGYAVVYNLYVGDVEETEPVLTQRIGNFTYAVRKARAYNSLVSDIRELVHSGYCD